MTERKADPAMYARVFENGEGALILEDLKNRYTQRLFFKGGEDGRRLTDFALGCNSVVDFLAAQIRMASDADPPDEDDSHPAA